MAGSGALPDDLIGERIAGRFVVERLIGRGELSTSFRAHDDRLHRRVTVKLFHPRHRDDVQVVQSQLAAAQSVARLSHENIALVIDRGEHEGMPLVVLEHVRGENLQERIDRYAPLPVGEVVGYALQIARALAYAHGHGVVHGNLRPGNVLLTEDREPKLVDFGGGSYVAQLVGDPFAAPELREVDPDDPPEPSDDIFSLGALTIAALVERPPVPGVDPSELQLLRPDISPRLAAVVARAVSQHPDDRHASMRELAAELAGVREATAAGARGGAADHGATQAFAMPGMGDTEEFEEAGSAAAAPDATPVVRRAGTGRRRVRRERTRSRSPRETRARILAWSMVLGPLLAVVIFGLMIAGERGEDEQARSTGTTPNGPTSLLPITSVTSFDPGGDGAEHEEETAFVHDNDRETAWQSEGYDVAELTQLDKPGIGLIVDLGTPEQVRDVAIQSDLGGWTVQVLAADAPAAELEGWREVSEPVPASSGDKIPVDLGDEPTRYVLLWVTKLSLDPDDANSHRARIEELQVYGLAGDVAGE